MNNENRNHKPPESRDEERERLELEKLRLETELLDAGMRRDRVRLVLDIVKRLGRGHADATIAEFKADREPGRRVPAPLLPLQFVPRRPARRRRLPPRQILVAVQCVPMALIPNSE